MERITFEDDALRIMIEQMLRQGCSEAEVVDAVERATGSEPMPEPVPLTARLGHALRRLAA